MQIEILDFTRNIVDINNAANVNIEILRVKNLMSYFDFAEKLDYDLEILLHYCANNAEPSEEIITKICELNTIPISQFGETCARIAKSRKSVSTTEILDMGLHAAYLQKKYEGFVENNLISLAKRIQVIAADNSYTFPKLLKKEILETEYQKDDRRIRLITANFIFEELFPKTTLN